MASRRLVRFLLFATLFTTTFEKLYWNVAGKISFAEVFATLFLLAYASRRLRSGDSRVSRTLVVLLGFFVLFLLVYLVGFFNLETKQAFDQFGKGMIKFVLHFGFVVAAFDEIARMGERLLWRSLAWFCGGIAANAAYGLLQLATAQTGHNLDALVVRPLTGHTTQINIYGAVAGSNVYRVDGLTGDPNHLGIFLIVGLLVLAPVYLRLEPRHRLRVPLALVLALMLVVEVATLSRSGALGLFVGFLVLLLPYRRFLKTRAMLAPLSLAALVVLYEFFRRKNFFDVVIASRLHGGGRSNAVHFQVYDFIPQVLRSHPLFGLGFNNFSVYYEFVTGKTNWGPHSFYVALLVETGVVGTALFAGFLWYLFRRLKAARSLGRALWALRDPAARRVRPLAWGLTAALAGTMAANAFYLTMTFFYFYAVILLIAVVPVVFARRLELRHS